MKKLVLCALLATACTPAEELGADAGGGGGADAGVTATFSSLYGDYFAGCKNCHAPGAPGRTPDIETSLDFSTKTTAYMSVKTGMATGLTGNFKDCNGVPFVAATAASSLLVAALDQPTRQAFDLAAFPNCDVDTIADQTLKSSMQPSPAFIAALKSWVAAGAPNN